MVHTQYQQFIATCLLGGVLLQSCGNPSWKLEATDGPELSIKTDSPKKFPDDTSSQSLRLSQDSKKQVFVETSTTYSASVDGVFHEAYGDRGSPSSSTLTHNLVLTTTSKHMPNRQSPRPLSTTALGSSDHMPVSTPLSQNASLKSENEAITSSIIPMSPFFLAFGQEVLFSPVGDYWQARVTDIWGTFSRETTLLVICKEDVSVALHNLQGQEAIYTQRRIHILETDQPPWAPRVVYVGAIGLRGGMKKKAKQVQEQTDSIYASRTINHIVRSSLQLNEPSYNEQNDEACQTASRKVSSEPRTQNMLTNTAIGQASIKDTYLVDLEQKEPTKERLKEQDLQILLRNESPATWHPPFAARAVPAFVPSHLLQGQFQRHVRSASDVSSLAHASVVRESITSAQLSKDTKLPCLSQVTAFSSPEEAQEVVESYLARWHLATPTGSIAIRSRGKEILRNVETLKKSTKYSYRQQVLGFEMCDIEPMVWNRVLAKQKETKEQIKVLRGLRARLLDAFQFNGPELKEAGLRTTLPVAVGTAEYYSSDEETQQLSDQSRRNHTAFVVGIGKVLQERIEELLGLLFDEAIGTTIAPYIALFSSTPELPDLLGDYTVNFLHQTDDEEHKAELLGSLLTEVILQFVPLPKIKKVQLNKLKHKLGQAAQRVALQYSNQSKNLPRKKNS